MATCNLCGQDGFVRLNRHRGSKTCMNTVKGNEASRDFREFAKNGTMASFLKLYSYDGHIYRFRASFYLFCEKAKVMVEDLERGQMRLPQILMK